MKIKILKKITEIADAEFIEEVLDVFKVEEDELYSLKFYCRNGEIIEYKLEDIMYLCPFSIILK